MLIKLNSFNNMPKVGIIIGRLNPPHLGHISLINKSLRENEKTLIVLGSSNIINKKNPISFQNRKELLEIEFSNNSLLIKDLDDYESDEIWFGKLKDIINQDFLNYDLNFYGGDLKNDYAIKVIKEYEKYISNNINYIELDRSILPISATQIRDLFNINDIDSIKNKISSKMKKNIITFLKK